MKGDAQALAEFEVVRYKAIVKEKFQGSDTEESNFHHNQGHKRRMISRSVKASIALPNHCVRAYHHVRWDRETDLLCGV